MRLNQFWAHELVQRRATTAKSRHSIDNFYALKKSFLDDVCATVTMEEVLLELIMNWDQTGIKLVLSSSWMMEQRGSQRVEMICVIDKQQITAIFWGTILGDFLPMQLIYEEKTSRCHPRFQFPSGWDITHSPKHWSTEDTMMQCINNIIIPYVESVRQLLSNRKPALIIMVKDHTLGFSVIASVS